MDNKFFTFIAPYLSYIDRGKLFSSPFHWLYALIAVINLLFPLLVLYFAIDEEIFDAPAKVIFAFIFIWLVIAFAGWVSFQMWWDRKGKVLQTTAEDNDYPATPVLSHFIQTSGEWIGTWIAIVGFGFAFFATVFLGDSADYLARSLDLPFVSAGFLSMIVMPIYGFLIIVFSRLIAEQFRALVAIAKNTKK
ncbi:MAG: hypothetical protein LBR34_00680, partial [Prevotella sp.]|nr:hypothetical protein [Prevotella sp.]